MVPVTGYLAGKGSLQLLTGREMGARLQDTLWGTESLKNVAHCASVDRYPLLQTLYVLRVPWKFYKSSKFYRDINPWSLFLLHCVGRVGQLRCYVSVSRLYWAELLFLKWELNIVELESLSKPVVLDWDSWTGSGLRWYGMIEVCVYVCPPLSMHVQMCVHPWNTCTNMCDLQAKLSLLLRKLSEPFCFLSLK